MLISFLFPKRYEEEFVQGFPTKNANENRNIFTKGELFFQSLIEFLNVIQIDFFFFERELIFNEKEN